MKVKKILGVTLGLVAAAIAFGGASSASATTLTCTNPPNNKVQCPAGTIIQATSEDSVFHATISEITCTHSFLELETTNAGSSSETIKAKVKSIDFTDCGDWHVTVLQKGEIEFHTHQLDPQGASGWGTVTYTGLEVTIKGTDPLPFHCIFRSGSTDVGTATGSTTTGGAPRFDIQGVIPRTGGSSGVFCGSTVEWTDSYTFISPSWMEVDHVKL